MSFVCPYCRTVVLLPEGDILWVDAGPSDPRTNCALQVTNCPNCSELIIRLGEGYPTKEAIELVSEPEVIYPRYGTEVSVPGSVPRHYANEYFEAARVRPISPKASAALGRRLVQLLLREEHGVRPGTLSQEIDQFISRADVPSLLRNHLDAVRLIGNFAAHPIKSKETGAIADVGPQEADWLLDLIHMMLDFTFAQPKRFDELESQLSRKLAAAGKPPMKKA